MQIKNNRKTDGINKPLELHKEFLQKNFCQELFYYLLQLPTMRGTSFFSLVASNGSMLLFWSRSGKETGSLFSFQLNGRDSSLVFWLALLYSPSPFLLEQIISNPTPFLPFPFGQNFSKSNSSSLISSDKNIPSPISILQKYSKTIPNSVLAAKSIRSRKNILSPISFLT